MQLTRLNNNQLDSYSLLICSKYFRAEQDFINIICVNSKFKETTEKLRFNPIPIKSLKLFPNIQTQYLYSKEDEKVDCIHNYELWFKITYDQYLKYQQDNIKCHSVVYTYINRKHYNDMLQDDINELGSRCYYGSLLKSITIPTTVKSLFVECFSNCELLTSIDLPSTLTSINDCCFSNCLLLQTIVMPKLITSLGYWCFMNCSSLTSIDLPNTLQILGNCCFYNCSSLRSITLPSTITSLGTECFENCTSLKSINIPSLLTKLNDYCFFNCKSLQSIDLPSTITTLGDYCFNRCINLETINQIEKMRIGKKCFENCNKLKHEHV